MIENNSFELKMKAVSENESFARHLVGEFVLSANPTIDELEDIKTSVSEAVTNAIIHGYEDNDEGIVTLKCSIYQNKVVIIVEDSGVGIDDVAKALEPFYTTKPDEERSGMGLPLIKSFMSKLEVASDGNGTRVTMTKFLH